MALRNQTTCRMSKSMMEFFPHEPIQSTLLSKLWDIQKKAGYITDEAIRKLAISMKKSVVEIEGIISFYHFLHRRPTAKNIIYLNNSIISDIKGYSRVKESFERETDTRFGTSDRTGTFALFETPCIGLSDQEPAALINFYPFTNLNIMKVRRIISQLNEGADPADICDEVEDNIRYTPPNDKGIFFRHYNAGEALSKLETRTPEDVIEFVKLSSLAGRGGAFFPTWIKWDEARKQPTKPKYVVCNADEGEPGTFKDRVLLNREPGSVIEGMIIAGFAVGAKFGIIYLRAEYSWLKPRLENTINEFYQKGLLGKNITGRKGFDFDIRIHMGAGSYVCGEETALLESMEGKRGEPRTKWYFPVERGYLQKPTIVNNVETFAAVARMIEIGINNYLNRGIPGSPGNKLISLSGDVAYPGIYEIEWGMSIGEILELSGAADPYFIQVSGPSGECVSINEKHRKISMRDLMATQDIRCGGSFMVFNKYREILDILLNFSDFFMKESCGICTPCRAGNYIVHKKLEKINRGAATTADINDLKQWCQIMKTTSRCGLGKTACNGPVFALEKFGDFFEPKLDSTFDGLNHKFDLELAVSDYEKYKS